MPEQDKFRNFVQNVIDNIKKHGFPNNKVAFPIESMYEAAEKKDINFNKVLETLDEIQIAHEKTPEKIIFYPKDRVQKSTPPPSPNIPGIDPGMFDNIDPSIFENVNMQDILSSAAGMMQNMSPEQLGSIKSLYENMSDEERAALMEQLKKLGLMD